ncbi:MAG: GGDEF domain-containing protein [bacterium]
MKYNPSPLAIISEEGKLVGINAKGLAALNGRENSERLTSIFQAIAERIRFSEPNQELDPPEQKSFRNQLTRALFTIVGDEVKPLLHFYLAQNTAGTIEGKKYYAVAMTDVTMLIEDQQHANETHLQAMELLRPTKAARFVAQEIGRRYLNDPTACNFYRYSDDELIGFDENKTDNYHLEYIYGTAGKKFGAIAISKNFDIREIRNKMRSAIGIIEGVLLTFERYTTDDLTGLRTKGAFETSVRNILKAFSSAEIPTSTSNKKLFYGQMDIDNFKTINDTFGHNTGDDVLAAVGQTIRELSRSVDRIGRIGGEEFGILLKADSLSSSDNVLRVFRRYAKEINKIWICQMPDGNKQALRIEPDGKCFELIRDENPLKSRWIETEYKVPNLPTSNDPCTAELQKESETQPVPLRNVTLSCGLTEVPQSSDFPEQLLKEIQQAADTGLYHSKEQGRNRTTVVREKQLTAHVNPNARE